MFSVTKVGNEISSRYVREFIADTVADINKLPRIDIRGTQNLIEDDGIDDPVHAGSSCIVLEDSSVWMLGNDNIWHEI